MKIPLLHGLEIPVLTWVIVSVYLVVVVRLRRVPRIIMPARKAFRSAVIRIRIASHVATSVLEHSRVMYLLGTKVSAAKIADLGWTDIQYLIR